MLIQNHFKTSEVKYNQLKKLKTFAQYLLFFLTNFMAFFFFLKKCSKEEML